MDIRTKKRKKTMIQAVAGAIGLSALFATCPCCSRGILFNILYTFHITEFWNAITSTFNNLKLKLKLKRAG